jgi:hypothetical protein
MFQTLLDDVPAVRGSSSRRRCRPVKVHADKGYDSAANRAYLRRGGSLHALPGVGSSRQRGLGGAGGRSNGLGPGFGSVVCVRAGGLRGGRLEPARAVGWVVT